MTTQSSTSLSAILKQSLLIWQKSAPLVYIHILFGLIVSMLLANPLESMAQPEYLLFVFSLLIALIFCAFMAGLFEMTSSLCRYFLQNSPFTDVFSPSYRTREVLGFSLYKEFLPGISQRFIPVVIGMGIQVLSVAGLLACLFPLWKKAVLAIQPILAKMIANPNDIAYTRKLFLSLSDQQLDALQNFGFAALIAIIVYGLFWMLTCLWPVMLLWYSKNPLKAYWLSIRQFFRDPFRLSAIILLYWLISSIFCLFASTDAVFIAVFSSFCMVFLNVGFQIALFVYAWRAMGIPTNPLEEESLTSSDEKTPPSVHD